MPCFKPLDAQILVHPTTGRQTVNVLRKGSPYRNAELPCGRCIGCRIEKSREWAIRCVHEASMHDANAFLTLTYNDENLPGDGSLVPSHLTGFIKSLRNRLDYRGGPQIRYFGCGEYGEQFARPHYHLLLFGYDFQEDKKHWQNSNGIALYRSEFLESVWTKGHSSIGDLTFESAAYCARYVTKKITGEKSEDHYQGKHPEFLRCSNRPGIGQSWYQQYYRDLYPKDFITHRGKKFRVPRYYDRLYSDGVGAKAFKLIKLKRDINREKFEQENTPERLDAKEQCAIARYSRLPRAFEAHGQ